jgi:hypothetical protein
MLLIDSAQWFSNPKLSDHLWAWNKKGSRDSVMPNIKEMTKQSFPKELKTEEKRVPYRDHLMSTRWRDVRHI